MNYKKNRVFVFFTVLIINALSVVNIVSAQVFTAETDCLSPVLNLDTPALNRNFQLSIDMLRAELSELKVQTHAKNLIKSGVRKKDIAHTIKSNIANGLALTFFIDSVPGNLDKWFEGIPEEAAARFQDGFDFEKDTFVQKEALAGLAHYLSSLDDPSRNVFQLKLEQFIRNTRRSVDEKQLEGLRIVVLLGQENDDPFAQRKVLGYSGKNTIYVHINSLLLTETEPEKEAMGIMLQYQANVISKGRDVRSLYSFEAKDVDAFWSKKELLSEEEKKAEAERLHYKIFSQISKFSWLSLLRLPFNMQDYAFNWTQASRNLRKIFRDTVYLPWLKGFSWMSPKKTEILWMFEPMYLTTIPRFFGFLADQHQRAIEWMQDVEKKDTDWGISYEIALEKENSYRLLKFNDPRYKIDPALRPVIIVNPNAGHDSTIGKDIVDIFMRKGRQVYAYDWQSATGMTKEIISDLIANVDDCIGHVDGMVEVAALCQGGWVTASAEALLSSLSPDKVAAAYHAAVPFWATLGENEITKTVRALPEIFYHLLVYWLGEYGVQDGSHQLGGFEQMGDAFEKQVGFFLKIAADIDNQKSLNRTEGHYVWFYNKLLQLAPWYLESVISHFRDNDLYEGRYRTQVGHELRTVDFSKIKVPLILLSGTKDDITPPGVVLKRDIYELLSEDKNVYIDDVWDFLNEQGFISDSGEKNINREPGKKAVLENKIFLTSLDDFLSMEHPFIKQIDQTVLVKIYLFLREDCYGQCRALAKVVGTDTENILEIIMNRGHTGVFKSSNMEGEMRLSWNRAIDWAAEKVTEMLRQKQLLAEQKKQADKNRVVPALQKKILDQAVFKLKQQFIPVLPVNLLGSSI
jgi:hypothetical protein